MGWSLGYDSTYRRDIGYGVPAYCDHPDCISKIDRGLAYQCRGCELYFCSKHLTWDQRCARCTDDHDYDDYDATEPFDPKPDHPEWTAHKLYHPSWATWRAINPDWVRSHGPSITKKRR